MTAHILFDQIANKSSIELRSLHVTQKLKNLKTQKYEFQQLYN